MKGQRLTHGVVRILLDKIQKPYENKLDWAYAYGYLIIVEIAFWFRMLDS